MHNTYILVALFALSLVACHQEAEILSQEHIIDTTDSIRLVGTLSRPKFKSKTPLIILVHGSGNDSRENPYYTLLTNEFCKSGYAVFAYDKRGCNASTGDWLSVPFSTLKDDVLTLVNYFHKDTTILKTGLWGGSEGSTVAVWAASESPEIDFVIAQSFTAMSFAEQNKFLKKTRLRNYPNVSEQTIEGVLELQDLLYAYVRTGNGYDKYISEFQKFRNEPWFADILHEPVTENGLWSQWYKTKLDIQSSTFLESISVPVLFVWGQNDDFIDVTRSMQILNATRDTDLFTYRIFANADHSLYAGGRRPVHLQYLKEWLKKTDE